MNATTLPVTELGEDFDSEGTEKDQQYLTEGLQALVDDGVLHEADHEGKDEKPESRLSDENPRNHGANSTAPKVLTL